MKWRYATKRDTGKSRIRSGFLWLPRWIDGEARWLEFARWREVYYIGTRSCHWGDKEWLP